MASESAAAAGGGGGGAPPQNFFRDVIYQSAAAASSRAPWDIQRAQPALARAAAAFSGAVLDVGCGLGDNALWAARLPGVASVLAVDLAPAAVAEARARAAAASAAAAAVRIEERDVFAPAAIGAAGSFDTLLDSAVFHVRGRLFLGIFISESESHPGSARPPPSHPAPPTHSPSQCIGDDAAQRRYLAAVTPLIRRGGRAVLLVFSDENPEEGWRGPRRTPPAHARALWGEAGWRIDTLETDARYLDTMQRCEGKGGHALLMTATRT